MSMFSTLQKLRVSSPAPAPPSSSRCERLTVCSASRLRPSAYSLLVILYSSLHAFNDILGLTNHFVLALVYQTAHSLSTFFHIGWALIRGFADLRPGLFSRVRS